MKDTHNETTIIGNNSQSGGITAQNVSNVTINNNHYGAFSKSKFNFIFKSKPVKYSIIVLSVIGLAFGTKKTFIDHKIDTTEEFHQFLLRYQESVKYSRQDAQDFFADHISIFYKKQNIDPQRVNEERLKSDYRDGENKIDVGSIVLRKEAGIYYWKYKSAMICWRPSKNMFEKCMVEMEFGLDSDDRIASIRQIRYWDLKYTEDKPVW